MTMLRSYKLMALAMCLFAGTAAIAQPGSPGKDPSVPASGNTAVKDGWLPSLTPDGAYDRVPHISTAYTLAIHT